jgi:hypothetical protein
VDPTPETLPECSADTDPIAAAIAGGLTTLTDLQDFVNNATDNQCQSLSS